MVARPSHALDALSWRLRLAASTCNDAPDHTFNYQNHHFRRLPVIPKRLYFKNLLTGMMVVVASPWWVLIPGF